MDGWWLNYIYNLCMIIGQFSVVHLESGIERPHGYCLTDFLFISELRWLTSALFKHSSEVHMSVEFRHSLIQTEHQRWQSLFFSGHQLGLLVIRNLFIKHICFHWLLSRTSHPLFIMQVYFIYEFCNPLLFYMLIYYIWMHLYCCSNIFSLYLILCLTLKSNRPN